MILGHQEDIHPSSNSNSHVNGYSKAIDIEVQRVQGCIVWRNKEGTHEFEDWWDGHQHLCLANHLGSSGLKALVKRRMIVDDS